MTREDSPATSFLKTHRAGIEADIQSRLEKRYVDPGYIDEQNLKNRTLRETQKEEQFITAVLDAMEIWKNEEGACVL